jgi:hypothetical protein
MKIGYLITFKPQSQRIIRRKKHPISSETELMDTDSEHPLICFNSSALMTATSRINNMVTVLTDSLPCIQQAPSHVLTIESIKLVNST